MSASTVSVSANPRRRPSTVSDVKQNIEIVNDAANAPTTAADGGADKVTSGSKDLSHSIRGEAVLERSKDKKSSQLPPNSIRPRTRKAASGVSKTPKPRWVTVMSIVVKNLLVLLVFVGLAQMVWKLVVNSGKLSDSGGNLMGFSDMESRIAGVESSLKTTTKMLQVQVEVVDKKLESEVGNLRREVNKRIEDKTEEFGAYLRRLEEKSEGLESGLVELRGKEFVTKDAVVKLYDELKSGKGGAGVGLSFDEIRGLAREVVDKEIEKHAADGVGRVDYALASGGAMVVTHSEPLGGFSQSGSWLSGRIKNGVHSYAVKMLSPSFGEPGNCFPLKGSSGFVVIRLRSAIVPEAITLEHVAESVAYDRSSAPKNCRVSGWYQGQQGLETETDRENILLADIVYDLEKSNAQTINVLDGAKSSVIDTVRFDISSNHGSPVFTCIYRLRVHGHEPKSVGVISSDS